MVCSIGIKHDGRRRPRKNPTKVHADARYSVPLKRFYLDTRKVESPISSTATKKRPERPRLLDKPAYRELKYTVESFFA